MRSLVYIPLCILLALVPSLSCIKKVTIQLPTFEKRLVVHGHIAAGELFNVTIAQTTRTRSHPYVNDALVLLYEHGVLKDTLRYDSAARKYISAKVIAETGKPYTLKVEAPGFPSVEATATGPSLPALQSINHTRKARQNENGEDLDDVEFTFRDPQEVRNFYFTRLHPANGGTKFPCIYSLDPVIEREKSLLPVDENQCIDPEYVIYTDKSFDGQLKTITLSSFSSGFSINQVPGPILRPYIKRYAVDSAYYTYFKFTSFIFSSEIPPIFTENTEKKGNITNGYGIFSIYDVRTDSIR
jgi:hypothetical protein